MYKVKQQELALQINIWFWLLQQTSVNKEIKRTAETNDRIIQDFI